MNNIEHPIAIDMILVDKCAGVGATDAEIAAKLGISEKDLLDRCADVLRKARANRHVSLRNEQTKVAMEGNTTMLTWLGKHELQQNDKHENGAVPVKQYVGIDPEQV